MIIYEILTAACLAVMVLGLVTVVINLFKKNREDKINYLRDYKKGRIVLIYICVFPLFWMGLIYSGLSVIDGFIGSLPLIMDIVVLKFNIANVEALATASPLYNFTMYFSFALVGLNVILFALSLASQHLWNFVTNQHFNWSKKEKLVLIGNNEQNHAIYHSENNRVKLVVDNILGDDALSLYVKNIAYRSTSAMENYVVNVVEKCVKKDEKVYAVINTGDDDKNIKVARKFAQAINSLNGESAEKIFDLLSVFVFGDPKFEGIYEDVVGVGKGCISYVNKYQKMAVDFTAKYPYTRFMDANHIDYATSCVKNGVDINVVMLGFGKTNQQLFLTSVANNQFITQGENGVELKKVNYHLFDKSFCDENDDECKCSVNDKNLNHNYFRYKNECGDVINIEGHSTSDADCKYLPLPDYPAKETFHHLDVNDHKFYSEIKSVITKSDMDANFVIIAFGTDLENIDMAGKLLAKIKEWGVGNTTVFAKVRKNCDVQEEKGYLIIACEDQVYDIENIIGDDLLKMAGLRDSVYAIEHEVAESGNDLSVERIADIKKQAHRDWHMRKTQNERESNIYCVLSLRSKLNMMGLDYVKSTEEGVGLSEDEYLEIYAQSDMPDRNAYKVTADGKPIVSYTLDFKDSRRKNMAIHEHYRWNSFMISKGTVPATKEQILSEKNEKGRYTNGKNYALRRHGNLTTFDGLVKFRKMIAERDKINNESLLEAEARKDVIKYDYQLLDDAHWLLTRTGYKIVKK